MAGGVERVWGLGRVDVVVLLCSVVVLEQRCGLVSRLSKLFGASNFLSPQVCPNPGFNDLGFGDRVVELPNLEVAHPGLTVPDHLSNPPDRPHDRHLPS